jgi:hypothetical protein
MCVEKLSRNLKIIILLCLIINTFSHGITEDEIAEAVEDKIITCGSALRIQNVMTKFK